MCQGNSGEPKLLTAKEVAALLRMPASTVYHLAKTGRLPAAHIGRSLRFRSTDIEALLSGRPATHRILIVDDDSTILSFAGALLRRAGYEAVTASTIEAARGLVAEDSFDLLLIDVVLPDGKGTELIEDLSSDYTPERVIVMTAYADLPEVDELLRRHSITLLKKPLDPDHLMDCVDARVTARGQREAE